MSDWGMTIIATRVSAAKRQGVFVYDRWGLRPQIHLENFIEEKHTELMKLSHRDRVAEILRRRAAYTHDENGFIAVHWITPSDQAETLPEYVLAIRVDDLAFQQYGGFPSTAPPGMDEVPAAWEWLINETTDD